MEHPAYLQHEIVCLWMTIIMIPPNRGLSTLTKEITVPTSIIQNSSDEMSTLVYDRVKCKQTEVNIYTLNPLACFGPSSGCGVWYRAAIKLTGFRFQFETCLVTMKHCDTKKQSICGWLYIYIYMRVRVIRTSGLL